MKRNNNWLWRVWFVLVAGLVMTGVVFAQGKEVVRVIKTEPANNQKDVSPDLERIVVKFSSAMKTDSFSVVAAGQGETPEVIGSPEFTDEHTCVIKVRLKPATLYSIGFNSETRKGFQSKNGVPAKPFVLTFRTKETGSAGEIQGGASLPSKTNRLRARTQRGENLLVPRKQLFIRSMLNRQGAHSGF